MAEEAVSAEILVKRLRRIEGQVRGIQRMIQEARNCESIITQLAAVRSAIEGVGALVLNNYTKLCFTEDAQTTPANINSLARAIAIWGGVHIGEQLG